MTAAFPSVGAVVVHYRSEATLRATVDDLAALLPSDRIVVVDNSASLDPGGLPARVLVPDENVGYGAAVNVGVRSLPAAVTTVLVATHEIRIGRDDLAAMLHTLSDERIGQVGPVLIDSSTPDRAIWSAGGTYSRAIAWPAHRRSLADPAPVRWIDGACFLVERELFESVGGMPEHFFLYMEDIAFSRALQGAGYEVAVCPAARVDQTAKGPDLRLAVRNRWLLLRDYFPAHTAALGLAHLHLRACVLALVPTTFHRAKARQYRAAMTDARAIRAGLRSERTPPTVTRNDDPVRSGR